LISLDNLNKSRQSRKVSTVSINLDNLNKYPNAAKSQLKSLDFKNLNQVKKKLILTRWTISTVIKSWSRQIKKSRSWLVSTIETPRFGKILTYFDFEVCSYELERVQESVSGRQPDVVAGLVPLHPVDDGSQDLVGLLLQTPIVLKQEES